MQCTYWTNLEEVISEHTVLIAGTIGSGKSVLIDDLLYNISARSTGDALVGIIDLKRVQFVKWQGLPHLEQLGIAKDLPSAFRMIDRVTAEMEERYRVMESKGEVKYTGTRIYLIIDEMADLMSHKGVEAKLTHLLRLCRASNIAVIGATQSPSRKVITYSIRNNVVCTIGLRCSTSIESRQIVGIAGCEKLPRYGWAYMNNAEGLCKLQIPMTDDADIEKRVADWKEEVAKNRTKEKHRWWKRGSR